MRKKKIRIVLLAVLFLAAVAIGVGKEKQTQQEEASAQRTELTAGENQTLEEVQIKTIHGNEITFEADGQSKTMLIPVGTEVITKLGTTTTFSRLSAGNTIRLLLEDGEIISVQIMQ